jgi:hypothetical protein
MAFLLGCRSGAKISKYERFKRQPNLQTVFAYQAVFKTPAHELFAGLYQQVERKTHMRAQLMATRLKRVKPTPLVARKVEVLKATEPDASQKKQRSHE